MNAKRREDIIDVLSKRRILIRHGGSQGNQGHDGVHHHTWSQHSVNGTRYDPGPPRRRTPSSTWPRPSVLASTSAVW